MLNQPINRNRRSAELGGLTNARLVQIVGTFDHPVYWFYHSVAELEKAIKDNFLANDWDPNIVVSCQSRYLSLTTIDIRIQAQVYNQYDVEQVRVAASQVITGTPDWNLYNPQLKVSTASTIATPDEEKPSNLEDSIKDVAKGATSNLPLALAAVAVVFILKD